MSRQPAPAPASKRAPAPVPAGSKTNTASTVAGGKKATGSSVEPAPSGTDFATVSNTYKQIWSVTPYTSFVMFDYLLKTAPAGTLGNWGTFLASHKPNLAEAGLRTVAAPTDRDQALWNGKSGLCTSFTIKVATEAKVAGIQYGNQTKKRNGKLASVHRAGWEISGTSAIVIDSSARQAIQFKDTSKPSGEFAFQGEVLTQKIKGPFAPCLPKGPEGWKAAMQICLEQLLPQNEMLLMFRSVLGRIGFTGTVRWNFQDHTWSFSTLRDKEVSIVTFGVAQTAEPSAPPADHTSGPDGASGAHTADPAPAPTGPAPAQIVGIFTAWIRQVKARSEQWTPELVGIQAQLWDAAVKSWGAPTYKYFPVGVGEPAKGTAPSALPATRSKIVGSGAKTPNAKAPVDMKTAPGTQPVPGGLTGSLAQVGVNALLNVKKQ
ncbi:hypothetical protein JMJ35_008492 [Cladonia borealis]|uniref:Uncharacterized protein n=1 Tax=Cladonia borealis TaxID=184061 RepID=A0AA39QWG9_9LECA|nr:hypothetical protein JMJ35_008492 [Cladonia borealis]